MNITTTSPRSCFSAVIRSGALLATLAGAHAAPVLIDFSIASPEPGVADSNGNRWTSIGPPVAGTAANSTANHLISSTGAVTTINIGIVFSGNFGQGFGGPGINGNPGPAPFNFDGPTPGNPVGNFAIIDGIYSAYTPAAATVTFTGLEANTPYDLSLIGGRASNGSDGQITRTIGTGDTGGALLNDGTVLNLTVTSDNSGVMAFTFADANPDTTNQAGATLNAMSLTQLPQPGFPLTITAATAPASGFILEWESQEGKLYNIRTSTALAGEIGTWELVEGDIAGTAPMNQFNVTPVDSRRFYAVEEFNPPPLLSADFEGNDGNFTVTTVEGSAWEYGAPDSNGLGGTVDSGNDGSVNAWGTNLGTFSSAGDPSTDVEKGIYANPTHTILRSPIIDLTGVDGAVLTFAEALDLPASALATDSAVVNLINANTDEVIAQIHVSADADLAAASWNSVGPINLAPGVGQNVRIEWRLEGTGGASHDYLGWYIDDVLVVQAAP